jgi:hypothetical protein
VDTVLTDVHLQYPNLGFLPVPMLPRIVMVVIILHECVVRLLLVSLTRSPDFLRTLLTMFMVH